MITVGGNMTGSGAWMSPAEKQRAIQGGWRPYTIYGKPTNAPDWMKLALSLTSDIPWHFGLMLKQLMTGLVLCVMSLLLT